MNWLRLSAGICLGVLFAGAVKRITNDGDPAFAASMFFTGWFGFWVFRVAERLEHLSRGE